MAHSTVADRFAVRLDFGGAFGVGHLSRCLKLLPLITSEPATFYCHHFEPSLINWIEQSGHQLKPLKDESVETVLASMEQEPWLLLDHYQVNAQDVTTLRSQGMRVLQLDDLGDRAIQADILLDSGSDANARKYDGLLAPHTLPLLGLPFFVPPSLVYQPQDDSLAIHLGGVSDSLLLQTVEAIVFVLREFQRNLPLTIVLPPHFKSSSRQKLTRFLQQAFVDFSFLNYSLELPEQLAKIKWVVGALGVSAWERIALGQPAINIQVADNQNANAHQFQQQLQLPVVKGRTHLDVVHLQEQLVALLTQEGYGLTEAARAQGKQMGMGLLDLHGLVSGINENVWLRPWQRGDRELLYDWQQIPIIRRHARNSRAPSRQEHNKFFDRVMNHPDHLNYIIRFQDQDVGVVRLDQSKVIPEVSIYLVPGYQGKGIARKALALLDVCHPNLEKVAFVKEGNSASRKLFLSAGYQFKQGQFHRSPSNSPVLH